MIARLRALLRIEWRHLVRSPIRSGLVVLLLAVPVAAVVGGSVLLHVALPTRAEQIADKLGTADRKVDGPLDALHGAASALPIGATAHWLGFRPDYVRARGLALSVIRYTFDPQGPLLGRFRVVEGRAPRSAQELAVSPAVWTAAGLALGDAVESGRDAVSSIVGVVADPERLGDAFVVDASTAAPAPQGSASPIGAALFIDSGTAGDEAVDTALRAQGQGLTVTGPAQAAQSMSGVSQAVLVFGSLGFVEAALVVAAAFVIGLRRRQREIGLVGSVGARQRDVVVGVLASAVLLALIGSALGVGIGLAVAAWLHPHLDDWAARFTGQLEVPWALVAAACLLAILTATLAAVWPARWAARMPVLQALSGRRPLQSAHGVRWLRCGVVLVVLGVAATLSMPFLRDGAVVAAAIGGAVLGVLGFGACSPWLLERLGRWAARLPLPWRLAVRDASRFRSRNGPVVTAVLAGMAVSVTIAAVLASVESIGSVRPSLAPEHLRFQGAGAAAAAAEAAEELGAVGLARLQCAYHEGQPVRAIWIDEAQHAVGGVDWLAVTDPDLMRVLGTDSAAAGQEASSPVVLSFGVAPQQADGVQLRTARQGSPPVARRLSVASVVLPDELSRPRFAVSRSTLEHHGLTAGPWPAGKETWLVRLDREVDETALGRARVLATAIPGTGVDAAIVLQQLPQTLYRVALLLSVLVGLLVLGVTTALTAVESRDDRLTLVTLGASPRLRRAHAAAATGYLALLGCTLAIPAGLLPAFGVVTGIGGLTFRVPWWELGITAVGLPVLAYALAWVTAHPRRLLRPTASG